MSTANNGDTVRIHYTGTLTDGTQFDSSIGRDPLEFKLGEGQIIPGLEREIAGMAVGDTKTVTVAADEAYGQHRAEAVHAVERTQIPEDIELAIGVELQATGASGQAVRLGFMEDTVIAFRSIDWKFVKPVFIGDTVHLRVTVEEKKAMRRLGGGLVNFKVEVVNQADDVTQRGNWELLVKGEAET